MSEGCVNPHEKIYHGCTDMCKDFSGCKAKDVKKTVEGELKKELEGLRDFHWDNDIPLDEVEEILDKMWQEFPTCDKCERCKPLPDGKLWYVGEEYCPKTEWFLRWKGKP